MAMPAVGLDSTQIHISSTKFGPAVLPWPDVSRAGRVPRPPMGSTPRWCRGSNEGPSGIYRSAAEAGFRPRRRPEPRGWQSMDDGLVGLGVVGCGGFGLFALQQF